MLPYTARCELPRRHLYARVRASTTGTVPQALTATVVRAPEHRARASRTESPAQCIGGPRFRGFPVVKVGECPRSGRRPDLHNGYPGFSLSPCLMPKVGHRGQDKVDWILRFAATAAKVFGRHRARFKLRKTVSYEKLSCGTLNRLRVESHELPWSHGLIVSTS